MCLPKRPDGYGLNMRFLTISDGRVVLRNTKITLVNPGAAGAVPVDPGPVDPGTGTAVITLLEPLDQQVYQRVGTSKAVPLSLSYTGDATLIQARAVPVGTPLDSTAYAWSNLTTNETAKTAIGTPVVQQGGWYVWQARPYGNSASGITGTKRFGVGAIIGVLGQSNSINFMTGGEKFPTGHPRSVAFDGVVIKRLGAIYDNLPVNSPYGTPGHNGKQSAQIYGGGDAPTYMANLLGLEFDIPVCFVEKGNGGKGFDYFTSGTKPGWTDFVTKLNQVGGDMELLVWSQGESDAHIATQATFSAAQDRLMEQCLAQTGRNVNSFKIAMVGLGPGKYSGSTEGEFGRYRTWQRDYATSTPGWFHVGGAYAASVGADYVHYDGMGHALSARQAIRTYLSMLGRGVTGAGPYIVSASRTGLQVRFVVGHTGGTLITDGVGGSGASIKGFRFFDAGAGGAQIGYTATSIDGNAIVVTLASLPSGTLTADFAITDVPCGSYNTSSPFVAYVPASAVRDNVTLLNSTVGCLMQPCAAITVS